MATRPKLRAVTSERRSGRRTERGVLRQRLADAIADRDQKADLLAKANTGLGNARRYVSDCYGAIERATVAVEEADQRHRQTVEADAIEGRPLTIDRSVKEAKAAEAEAQERLVAAENTVKSLQDRLPALQQALDFAEDKVDQFAVTVVVGELGDFPQRMRDLVHSYMRHMALVDWMLRLGAITSIELDMAVSNLEQGPNAMQLRESQDTSLRGNWSRAFDDLCRDPDAALPDLGE